MRKGHRCGGGRDLPGAFGKVVSSMVSDIIMPPIGLLSGFVIFIMIKQINKLQRPNFLQPSIPAMKECFFVVPK